MDSNPHLRRNISPAALIRGAALEAAIRWFEQSGRTGYELPPRSTHPSSDEMSWNVWRMLYARDSYYSLVDTDQMLRMDFRRYCMAIKAVLSRWQDECPSPEDEAISGDEWFKLCYLLMNNCSWPYDKIVAHIRLQHCAQCKRCRPRE